MSLSIALSTALLCLSTSSAPAGFAETTLPAPATRIATASAEPLTNEELLFLGKWSELLGLLPLDQLAAAEMDAGRLRLRFDFGDADTAKLELAGEQRWILKDKRGRFDLTEGSVKRTQSDARKLRVASEVELTYDLAQGITGVREGDLEVHAFFAWRSIEVRAFETAPQLAVNDDGHLLLAQDAAGAVLREHGEVLPEAHVRWLTITCSGREIRCGLGEAQDGRRLVAAPSE
jgi:hypothetical protein